MLAFDFLNYHISVSPVYAMELLNQMWATEPVGTTSILLTSSGLFLTLLFKLLDFWWDVHKEQARQGKLQIELTAEHAQDGQLALCALIANTGKEPIVVRDIGYARPRLLGQEFIRIAPTESPLPHALNARELVHLVISEEEADLHTLAGAFRVKDSLGKVWETPDGETRKARKQLKNLKTTLAHLPQTAIKSARLNFEEMPSSAPLSTQN